MPVEPIIPTEEDPEEGVNGSHVYRIGFWRQQEPPEGSDTPPDEMGWGVIWWEVEAEDVHEVIAWADEKAAAEDRIYTLYVRFTDPYPPEREWMIRIAGADPTRNPDYDDGFHRQHPLRPG